MQGRNASGTYRLHPVLLWITKEPEELWQKLTAKKHSNKPGFCRWFTAQMERDTNSAS